MPSVDGYLRHLVWNGIRVLIHSDSQFLIFLIALTKRQLSSDIWLRNWIPWLVWLYYNKDNVFGNWEYRLVTYTWHKILLLLPRSCMNFSDASENVYAAVIYLSVTGALGNVHASFIISIRPQSSNSIPRLELCGPHLLSKLLHHVWRFSQFLVKTF